MHLATRPVHEAEGRRIIKAPNPWHLMRTYHKYLFLNIFCEAGMAIARFDPVAVVEVVQGREQRVLENLPGRRVGWIFNHPVSSPAFCKGLE